MTDPVCPDHTTLHYTRPAWLPLNLSLIWTWVSNKVRRRDRETGRDDRRRWRVLMLVMERGKVEVMVWHHVLESARGRLVDHLEAGGGGTVTIPSVSTALPTRQLLSEELQWGCHTPLYCLVRSPSYLRFKMSKTSRTVTHRQDICEATCHALTVSLCHDVRVLFGIKSLLPAWPSVVLLGDRTAEQWKLLFFKFSNFCKVFCRA